LHERLAQTTFDLLFVNAGVTNDPGETGDVLGPGECRQQ
jgi:hypothetical protein